MMGSATGTMWATVLAGGAGKRLANLTGGVPKQYCRFGLGGTLLAQTLERIAPVVPPTRTVLVVERSHRPYVDGPEYAGTGTLVYQPCDRGTAAGVLFGLLPAMEAGENPVVLLTPSDHGVIDTSGFLRSIASAAALVESDCRRVALFGVEASGPDTGYGWISPEAGLGDDGSGFRRVGSFVEKPDQNLAARLLADHAVWNTMVVVARLSALVELYRQHLPDVLAFFEHGRRLPERDRRLFFERWYRQLPELDFCRHLLTPAEGLWYITWPATLGWSDLGTPERLRRWLTYADLATHHRDQTLSHKRQARPQERAHEVMEVII